MPLLIVSRFECICCYVSPLAFTILAVKNHRGALDIMIGSACSISRVQFFSFGCLDVDTKIGVLMPLVCRAGRVFGFDYKLESIIAAGGLLAIG